MKAAEYAAIALIIIGGVAFLIATRSALAAIARNGNDYDRRRILHLLAVHGPLDGGHLLSSTPLSKDLIAARMAELVEQGLVTHEPSSSDPFWRDLWRITDAGRRVAS